MPMKTMMTLSKVERSAVLANLAMHASDVALLSTLLRTSVSAESLSTPSIRALIRYCSDCRDAATDVETRTGYDLRLSTFQRELAIKTGAAVPA